jgi:hypothetical protein
MLLLITTQQSLHDPFTLKTLSTNYFLHLKIAFVDPSPSSFGDCLFSCVYHSKNNLHNHIRDTCYYILQCPAPPTLCNRTHSPHNIHFQAHNLILSSSSDTYPANTEITI